MQPVVKRILVQGGLTAGVLALVGVLFAEMAGIWIAGQAGKPGSADLNPPLSDSLRYRVPLTLAGGGFLFVAVGELVALGVRGRKKSNAGPVEPQPDDAEKLLNELLAQAESKMALEAETQKAVAADQPTESSESKSEGSGQERQAGHKADAGGGDRSGPPVL
ncbi:MAG: hypothetical protein J0I06_09475 [Planctomycetes bacterium]|nr:hypothetical protein [Planctomycetota bacterium]